MAAEPYQLTFTKAYAYVRGLASPKVTMINLSSLGEGRSPIVQGFEAGPAAPRQAGDLPLAQGLSVSRDDNSVFVVNPVDNTTYFYAEGMNAPMSGYNNRGHQARAAIVIDRSLRERGVPPEPQHREREVVETSEGHPASCATRTWSS